MNSTHEIQFSGPRIVFQERRLPETATLAGYSALIDAYALAAPLPRDLLARTSAFLLLKDSRSSYAIEGGRPPQDRIQRWGRAIGEACRQPLDRDELPDHASSGYWQPSRSRAGNVARGLLRGKASPPGSTHS